MVVRRPKAGEPTTSAAANDAKKLELMEHLVKKSLAVNPQLTAGMSTREAVEELKGQAQGRRGTQDAPVPGAPTQSVAERRKNTIAFFFEQKAGEFQDSMAEIDMRQKLLDQERTDLQGRVCSEIVDFLSLMAGGAESPEARMVMRDFKELLRLLGVTDNELAIMAKGRQ